MKSIDRYTLTNVLLLFFILLFLLVALTMENTLFQPTFRRILFATVLLVTASTINNASRWLWLLLIPLVLLNIVSALIPDSDILEVISTLPSILFFFLIVFKLINQIAMERTVDGVLLLEVVNGYLLLALSGAVLFAMIGRIYPEAYSINHISGDNFADALYLGIITFTTIGFGDITPLSGLARFVAVTVGMSGQLYLSIIVAIVVGKFLNQKTKGPDPK